MKQACYDIIDNSHDQIISFWSELVNMDSGTSYKEGVDAVAARVEQELQAIGFATRQIQYEKAGNALVAEYGDMTKPFIVLVGHYDTVFNKVGTAAERPFTIDDQGLAHGPGCLDMKGGVTIMLSAIGALIRQGYNKYGFKVILAGDEESAHPFSDVPELIMRESKGAKCAFNFETGFPDHGLVIGRKGVQLFSIETFGKGTHVGNAPELGRSAIIEMAHHMIALEELTDLEAGIKMTCGVISGGTVRNCTPEYCKVECDLRFKTIAQCGEIMAKVQEIISQNHIEGVTSKLNLQIKFMPMEVLDSTKELFSFVKDVYEEEGFGTPTMKYVGGGSDSAYTTAAGVPTICAMGVLGEFNHTAREYAIVDTMFMRAKLLIAVLTKL